MSNHIHNNTSCSKHLTSKTKLYICELVFNYSYATFAHFLMFFWQFGFRPVDRLDKELSALTAVWINIKPPIKVNTGCFQGP